MEKKRIKYYECNMTKTQHLLAWLFFSLLIGIVIYIYYHSLVLSIVGGIIVAFFQEKNYAKTTIRKRQNRLRNQFKEFLDIITISISGGSGQSLENAIKASAKELRLLFNEESDIVREIDMIISDYDYAGVPMKEGFREFAQRSDIDDIKSFATIYATIEGKTSDFGYIVAQTRDIIKDKTEITMEIETTITSAKSETNTMLVLPLIIIVAMSVMGSGFLDSLFTTAMGRAAATVGLLCTFISYVLASKATEYEV